MEPWNGSSNLFEQLGGRETLERVHKRFYDKLYDHPWLGQFFKGIIRTTIENQQTDFMTSAMGGPEVYFGRLPIPAHSHMNITPELFDLRHSLLKESLEEEAIPFELAQRWLKIDAAFKTGLVKKSLSDCKRRFNTDEILDYEDPEKKSAS